MADMFDKPGQDVRLLEPGAGIGSLAKAFAARMEQDGIKTLAASLYEIDPDMRAGLAVTLAEMTSNLQNSEMALETEILSEDYIEISTSSYQKEGFTHVIANPPYKKLGRNSDHAHQLSKLGYKTPNLYAAFLLLAARQLRPNGEMVAIVPRSFCNGPYFKAFRADFFDMMDLRRVHVFESRKSAFSDDKVLQESIILHAIKREQSGEVCISSSPNADFDVSSADKAPIGTTLLHVNRDNVFLPGDAAMLVHLPLNTSDLDAVQTIRDFPSKLSELDISISTGPVVDFRLRKHIHRDPTESSVPLIYAANLKNRQLNWPISGKKPQHIEVNADTAKWLWPTGGYYVVTKRFSSKEEKKRIVATVTEAPEGQVLCGWENHLNVIHHDKRGLSEELANGLAVFLNSSIVDRYFRVFNGHTQVNATDIRYLSFPSLGTLKDLGREFNVNTADQAAIDNRLNTLLSFEIAA